VLQERLLFIAVKAGDAAAFPSKDFVVQIY